MRELTTGYEHHPGFVETACPLQMPVNPSPVGTSSKGFACGRHGGHCLPSDKCSRWREDYISEWKAMRRILDQQAARPRLKPANRKDPAHDHD